MTPHLLSYPLFLLWRHQLRYFSSPIKCHTVLGDPIPDPPHLS
ncbi:hypothetical protein HanXRQr2_Chr01g0037061 [Helianthus annuus]|uniref:Uncharacterized protein n=1 Tax=Helianthus annuus TaxID=4232 RepID=A0A9K3JX58_HELAN|nr:hypothetical protein HanXRQr2_Chr01g0037061 [Helianthus annuus]KAJ0958131.1 hypothetical protein HanPSC8_Chr01g0035571 [Helianthus annuus]